MNYQDTQTKPKGSEQPANSALLAVPGSTDRALRPQVGDRFHKPASKSIGMWGESINHPEQNLEVIGVRTGLLGSDYVQFLYNDRSGTMLLDDWKRVVPKTLKAGTQFFPSNVEDYRDTPKS